MIPIIIGIVIVILLMSVYFTELPGGERRKGEGGREGGGVGEREGGRKRYRRMFLVFIWPLQLHNPFLPLGKVFRKPKGKVGHP